MCKIIVFVLILTAFAKDDFLSKFHQSDYKAELQRMVLDYFNDTYYYNFKIITYKFNRTTPAINFTIKTKIDIAKEDMFLVIQGHKFYSNQYRQFPIRFQINFCDAVKADVYGFEALKTNGNFTVCDIKKNTVYYIPNFVPNDANLPPLIPNGEYMSLVDFMYKGQTTAVARLYIKIFRPIKID